MGTPINTISATLKQVAEKLDRLTNDHANINARCDEMLELISHAQDELQYERAARDTLKWWAQTIRMSEAEGLKGSLREGLLRIDNLDNIIAPSPLPAAMIRIEDAGDDQLSAELRLTNVIKTLKPGEHHLYLGYREAEANEH